MLIFASKCVGGNQSLVGACGECVPHVVRLSEKRHSGGSHLPYQKLSNEHEWFATAGMNASIGHGGGSNWVPYCVSPILRYNRQQWSKQ
eukprot:8902164-Pyramimonas_sp.AAC.1